VQLLRRGVAAWNSFRYDLAMHGRPASFKPDLRSADLQGISLRQYDLRGADLAGAQLQGCDLCQSTLTEANLSGADLTQAGLNHAYLLATNATRARFDRAMLRSAEMAGIILEHSILDGADLVHAKITQARCRGASFRGADLRACRLDKTDFSDAFLTGANLSSASVVQTRMNGANLDGARIYGISAWDVELAGASQKEMIITEGPDPLVSTDDLEVAQFLYLMLNSSKLRRVIDTITSKVVLILGRFTLARKGILDRLRDELRLRDFIPVLFDFTGPASKDATGTVETLARMARFIIADLTDPSSIPHELATVIPFLRTTPVLPLRLTGSGGYSMFDDLARAYPWVLETYEYDDGAALIADLPNVISPANEMAEKFRQPR
jgi:uncharacterized protein YjbI with pentapeptide repeats